MPKSESIMKISAVNRILIAEPEESVWMQITNQFSTSYRIRIRWTPYTTRYLPHHQGLHPGHEEPQITQSTGRGVLVEEQPLPPVVSPTAESPGYVVESDPEEYEDDETKDGPVNYPMDRGEDGDMWIFCSGRLAVIVSTVEFVFSTMRDRAWRLARCTDSSDISHHLLPHLYYLIWSPTQSKNIQVSLHASFVDAVTARIPSPPLHQYTVLYISPPVDRRDDVPESDQPPHKRSCLFALGSSTLDAEERRRGSRKVGYGIRDTWVNPAEAVREIAPMTETVLIVEEEAYASREAWAHAIGLSQAIYYELQTHREQVYAHESQLHAHQTQLQLHALQEKRRRARQPTPDARVPDYQDASRDADSHI
ncbi:hypothetical protein Tco_0320127 [Tanacetum coccineum]